MKAETLLHEGKLLQEYIKENAISKQELCYKLSISQAMFNYHCRKENFSGAFRSKLVDLGIVLHAEQKERDAFDKAYISELQEEVRLLTQMVAVQKQFIAHLTTNCKHGHCLNFILDSRKS
ncbi:MAG: hypothetical protein V4615_17865 [Bacteroidota bacterium]